jgi:hypothetical protein
MVRRGLAGSSSRRYRVKHDRDSEKALESILDTAASLMFGPYVYHYFERSSHGFPFVFTVRKPNGSRSFEDRMALVRECREYAEAQFGIDPKRWTYDGATDMIRFSRQQDAFLFRMRWA